MPDILFATNRQSLPDGGPLPQFGDEAVAPTPGGLICARATVTNIDIAAPANGTITAITPLTPGGFAAADVAPLFASSNDILVFVHGCANSFEDAITRAGYNQVWLAAAGLAVASNFDVIAFTWPARSYVLANIVGDYVDYRHDQAMARQSAYHFMEFLTVVEALQQRTGKRRVNLLCHSMGNYVLAGGTERWFADKAVRGVPLFDEIMLAAADETATSFATPNDGRLADLWRLGREITVYYNNDDIAMALSHLINGDYRLGYDGPANKMDMRFFSPNVYEFVDCTGVDDDISTLLQAPDRSHQYYRQSPTVRRDIAAGLAGLTPSRKRYDAQGNFYSLF
jgi:esterase/lipase superfamily enzyme